MIHDLRVNSHGYPSFFEGLEEENIRKWDRILGRKEFLFREANEDTCRKKNLYEEEHDLAQEEFTTKYGMFGEKLKTEEEIAREKREHTHRLYMMSDVPEYVEISGKWLAAEGELRKYRDQYLKQGNGAYDEVFSEPVGLICRDGQKGRGGESKEDSLPLLSWAFCFFR